MSGVPLVSILCTTYNHEAFLRAALNGFLLQRTTFPFEVIVHDDASPDGTAAIIREYAALHPDIISPIFQTVNQRSLVPGKVMHTIHAAARGKYIAWCEGDDYWTDPLKLQKQIDHLESHPEDVLCFHAVQVEQPDGTIIPDRITHVPKANTTLEEIALKGNYIHMPSVVFRNVLGELPAELGLSPLGDLFLWVLLAEHGNLHWLPDMMATYRMGGRWSTRDRHAQLLGTAVCHGALATWAQRTGKDPLAGIFIKRLRGFLTMPRSPLTTADLDRFAGMGPTVMQEVSKARRRLIMGRPMALLRRCARFLKRSVLGLTHG